MLETSPSDVNGVSIRHPHPLPLLGGLKGTIEMKMNKVFAVALVSLAIGSFAQAKESVKTPIEKPDFTCEQEGTFFVVNTAAQRIWLTDTFDAAASDNEGLELNEVSISSVSGVYTFDSKFEMIWGSDLIVNQYTGTMKEVSPGKWEAEVTSTALVNPSPLPIPDEKFTAACQKL